MEYAAVFMIIFGVVLVFAAICLCTSREPRESFLLSRIPNIGNMPLYKAQKLAKEVGWAVGGVGAAIIVYFTIMLIKG